MKIVNLTPHAVTLVPQVGDPIVIAPAEEPARVSSETQTAGTLYGVPVIRQTLGEVQGRPDPADGVLYVVSRVVAAACGDRDDLLVPADLRRDEQGRIVGAAALEVPPTCDVPQVVEEAREGVERLAIRASWDSGAIASEGRPSDARYEELLAVVRREPVLAGMAGWVVNDSEVAGSIRLTRQAARACHAEEGPAATLLTQARSRIASAATSDAMNGQEGRRRPSDPRIQGAYDDALEARRAGQRAIAARESAEDEAEAAAADGLCLESARIVGRIVDEVREFGGRDAVSVGRELARHASRPDAEVVARAVARRLRLDADAVIRAAVDAVA